MPSRAYCHHPDTIMTPGAAHLLQVAHREYLALMMACGVEVLLVYDLAS